jgi:hypothetical protein
MCEICGEDIKFLDKHHIQSKSKGGTNKKENICFVCPLCHRKVHKGEIILEGKFMTTTGLKLIYHYKGEESITGLDKFPDVYIY